MIKKALNIEEQELTDVIFSDLVENPWHAFEIDASNMKYEFAKGSMFNITLTKKYDVGFSNWGLQWTTLEDKDRAKMKDAIWVQDCENNALKHKVALNAAIDFSNFLELRHAELNENGLLVLTVPTQGCIGQNILNEAKRELIQEEKDEAKKVSLNKTLTMNEYCPTEKEILTILSRHEHIWRTICVEERDIPCCYVDRPQEGVEMFKSYCNFRFEEKSYEKRFWEIANRLSGNYISSELSVAILILKKVE